MPAVSGYVTDLGTVLLVMLGAVAGALLLVDLVRGLRGLRL